MESNDALVRMLNLMVRPAFCVKDGTITHVNPAAQAHLISEGSPVSQILSSGSVEYAEFCGGCLYLTVFLGGFSCGASVSRIQDHDLFVLDCEENQAELQAMALAAQKLRIPLSNVMTLADKLFPQVEAQAPDTQEPLAQLNRGLLQLLRIVSNMSDAYHYSQLPGRNLETVDIRDYMEEIFSAAGELIAHAGVTLDFQNLNIPVFTLANPDGLERAIHNILSNAIKFSPKGGKISAKLTHRGSLLYLTIQDSGSHVSPALRDSMFSRYQRQPGIEDGRDGIGLGMVLIRSIAAQHGGTVLLEYPENGGTRITLTLSVRKIGTAMVQTPIFRVDYAGERDRRLLELSEVLPASLYEPHKIN